MKDWPAKDGSDWTDVNTIAHVERTRTIDGKTTTERHFYIASLPPDPDTIAHAIRAHWGVENGLHWSLDVGFAEDRRRIRDQNAAQNFATITRYALALLKRERTAKHGVPTKRKKAGWDDGYLLRVLTCGIPAV